MDQTSPERPKRFARIRAWKKQHPRLFWAYLSLGVVCLGLIIGLLSIWLWPQSSSETPALKVTKKSAPAAPKYYSPLTGIEVANQATTTAATTAIMIENSPDARPQSGIKQAGVIYEAVAEGGITRFLAIYQEAKPQIIGPVRSVRMYFVDWAAAYNASIAHIGGSAAALAEVRNGNYRDIDQFFNSGTYWRANDRYAPHNVYTSFEKIDSLNQAKGYTTSSFTGFPRVTGKPSSAPNATSVDINISSTWYNTHYDYEASSNTYLRSVGGAASNDREEGRITPSVVIAMKVGMSRVFEDGWREEISTIGSGTATIFQNGVAAEANWRKNSRMESIEFTDSDGKPIALNRGQTWIAAVPIGSGSVSWQ